MNDKTLNILITAGGTSEKIDSVRRISNSGSGKLGAIIAETFAASGVDAHIVYICSDAAVRPRISEKENRLEVITANDVAAVGTAIRNVLLNKNFDAIVHSMAISDYRVRNVSDSERIAESILERLSGLDSKDAQRNKKAIREALLSPLSLSIYETAQKISSDKEDLVVFLERAPKLIAMLRGLAQNAVIVGFKLLADVSETELIEAGYSLLVKNECDYVLANDVKTVASGHHEGLLISPDKTSEKASGKEAIANLIVKKILERLLKSE